MEFCQTSKQTYSCRLYKKGFISNVVELPVTIVYPELDENNI